ncbi:ATP-binding cassette domain-containing protein [Nonomuraea sp. NEAU-A123]|uniref:ATP-binding cassette domain-containing protein n=1 Tax=Nonomuraea sp. NEAU-A123 TaxID=2839649 RepID=UPI001BE49C74|nr:ATP-binding cassette domain-containing protein [Nonomuraea sp. NEAU-A123]MBT2235066.1 ATP-binding cassette domain-containing protein [Nonomuraea sp. NEAU-A123]
MSAVPAISVAGLRKSYGSHRVLDGIDFTIPQGTIFALLGPNGAGKTTAVQILSTLIKADAGELWVAGHDLAREPDKVRAAIGVTGQFSAVDSLLTGGENLRLMADLLHLGRSRGRTRARELLERFDLIDAAHKPAATYSGGMRRRLDLAMTMVGTPKLIFLDEPTTGLDPRSRRTMWQIVRDLVQQDGVTIFLTTQYLEEADELADRIALLSQGELVAEGTAEELKRLVPGGHVVVRFADADGYRRAAPHVGATSRNDVALTVQIPNSGGVKTLKKLLEWLDDQVIDVAELTVHTPDLDDVFLTLTKEPSR